MEIGGTSLDFLDLRITIVDNKLHTTVYSKPTDSHLYLQANSCHQRSSVNGIQKGVALRLRRICSTDEEFESKAKEYKAYLVARGHDPLSVRKAFERTKIMPRKKAREKVNKGNCSSAIVFSTKYNPRGPNVKSIFTKHSHLIRNCPSLKKIFPDGVMTSFKREKNLKELLMRGDPYNIKEDLIDHSKHGYKRCNQICDSCDNFVLETDHIISNATGRKYTIKKDFTCASKFVIYCAICNKCNSQGVGSTVIWKPRLANYKYHISKKVTSCGISKHFFQNCVDEHNPCHHLKFIILDKIDNTDNLSDEQIEELLLQKENFWIGTLVTQHQGMNGTHDWNRTHRRDKINQ